MCSTSLLLYAVIFDGKENRYAEAPRRSLGGIPEDLNNPGKSTRVPMMMSDESNNHGRQALGTASYRQ